MISITFDKTNPQDSEGVKTIPCCQCSRPIVISKATIADFRSMCPDCGEKMMNGTLDRITWYRERK